MGRKWTQCGTAAVVGRYYRSRAVLPLLLPLLSAAQSDTRGDPLESTRQDPGTAAILRPRIHRWYYRCRAVPPPMVLERYYRWAPWYYRWDQATPIEGEENLHRSGKAQ